MSLKLMNMSRNKITGPGFADIDLSGEKNTKITEHLVFRAPCGCLRYSEASELWSTSGQYVVSVELRPDLLNPVCDE
jgi:hypothetical protein